MSRDPNLDIYAMMVALGHEEDAQRPAATEAEIREAIDHWSETFAAMSAVAGTLRAPEGVWPRVEASVSGGLRPADEASPERAGMFARLWTNAGFWRLATGAAVAAALLLAVFVREPAVAPAEPAFVAVLQAPEGDRRAGFLVEIAADRTVRLVPIGTTAAGEGKALEFWTLADKAKGPESLGLVPGDRAVTVSADQLPSIADGQLFEVTLEPYGGSPIGRPTGPILFKGLAARTS